MTAIGLLFGALNANHYEDATAKDPRVDALRMKMVVREDSRYSREYLIPDKRSISNAVQVFFTDGSATEKVEVEYPIGHRRRRAEGIPLLVKKFEQNLGTRFSPKQSEPILETFADEDRLERTPVDEFAQLFVAAD